MTLPFRLALLAVLAGLIHSLLPARDGQAATPSGFVGGGGGDDRIDGNGGHDQIDGGPGDDIRGGKGKDRLAGGADDDVVRGGAGTDRLDGGTDEDIFIDDGRSRLLNCERGG